jgi:hypothetical protein
MGKYNLVKLLDTLEESTGKVWLLDWRDDCDIHYQQFDTVDEALTYCGYTVDTLTDSFLIGEENLYISDAKLDVLLKYKTGKIE